MSPWEGGGRPHQPPSRLDAVTQWFTDSFRFEFEKQATLMGRFNLGVFGKTGVGKSTLINAVFGEDVASTGIGAPVTQGSHLYVGVHGSLGLIDTRGLEMGRDDKDLLKDLRTFVNDRRKLPLSEQMHAAWYCVRALDRRFEESEAAFIRALDALDVPVMLVFTQVPVRDGEFHPDAVALAQHVESLALPIVGDRPFMTYALRDRFSGQPSYGLTELLDATFLVAPDAVHAALAAAQKIDLDHKTRAAQRQIAASVAAAATATAIPIPFSAAALLVPIQLSMMSRIAQLYAVPFDRAAMMAIASTTLATSAGRNAAAGLLKMIPGAGSVAGGVINASVASGLTLAMGHAWLTVVQKAAGGEVPSINGVFDPATLRKIFEEEFAKRVPRIRQRG